MFQEIIHWRCQFLISVEAVDFLPGTDGAIANADGTQTTTLDYSDNGLLLRVVT